MLASKFRKDTVRSSAHATTYMLQIDSMNDVSFVLGQSSQSTDGRALINLRSTFAIVTRAFMILRSDIQE